MVKLYRTHMRNIWLELILLGSDVRKGLQCESGEMVYASALGADVLVACGFESLLSYQFYLYTIHPREICSS